MTKTFFFPDEQNQKDAETAAHFHIKAAKLVQVIIILRKFVMEKSIFVISSLLDIHSIFTCSVIAFRAIDYPPPHPHPCANMPLSYIVQNMWTHIQAKAFVGTRGGGGRYAIKLFLTSIYFLVKNTVSAQN